MFRNVPRCSMFVILSTASAVHASEFWHFTDSLILAFYWFSQNSVTFFYRDAKWSLKGQKLLDMVLLFRHLKLFFSIFAKSHRTDGPGAERYVTLPRELIFKSLFFHQIELEGPGPALTIHWP